MVGAIGKANGTRRNVNGTTNEDRIKNKNVFPKVLWKDFADDNEQAAAKSLELDLVS